MARWSVALSSLVLGGVAGSFVAGPMLHGQNPASPPAAPLTIPKEITSYRGVVKHVLPAVVSIEGRVKKVKADRPTPRRRPSIDDPRIPEEFRKFFEDFGQAPLEQPDETPSLGFGSGFIVDAKGVILTNYHVVAGADEVEVQLKDGRKFRSHDIKGDRKTDLAIVRIKADTPLPYLEMGDSDAMEIGDRVLAVGAPFGLTGTVTAGIVSSKGRNDQHINMYEDFIQTDAAINPGNSGGPLVNLAGQVIGINSVIKSRSGGWQGIGFAISSNLAKNVMQSLIKNGVVHRGYLGVQISDLSPEVASRLDVKDQHGVLVSNVFDNSPAAKAGLKAGDVITSVGNKPIKNGQELQRLVAMLPLHKAVDMVVVRDGKSKVLPVTIEEQPNDFGTAKLSRQRPQREQSDSVSLGKSGISVKDVSGDEAEQLGYKGTTTGALITRVSPDSPAADAGLSRGMLITQVDKHPVKSAQDAQHWVEKGSLQKGLLLRVQSPQGGTRYVIVKAEAQN